MFTISPNKSYVCLLSDRKVQNRVSKHGAISELEVGDTQRQLLGTTRENAINTPGGDLDRMRGGSDIRQRNFAPHHQPGPTPVIFAFKDVHILDGSEINAVSQ